MRNFSTQAVSPRNDPFAAEIAPCLTGDQQTRYGGRPHRPRTLRPFARERKSQATLLHPLSAGGGMRFGTSALLWFSGIPLAIIFMIIILVHPALT